MGDSRVQVTVKADVVRLDEVDVIPCSKTRDTTFDRGDGSAS